MSNDNTLPEELKKQIDTEATNKTMKLPANNSFDVGYMQGIESGYIAGATEYAQYKAKYEQAIAHLQAFVEDIELGNTVSASIYREIKSFLDGK